MANAANETSLRATAQRLSEKVYTVAKESHLLFVAAEWTYYLVTGHVVPSREDLETMLHRLIGSALELALSQDENTSVSSGRFQVSLHRDTETSWSGRIDLVAQSWIDPGLDLSGMPSTT